MSELFTNISDLTDKAKDYIDTKVERFKLDAAAKVSSVTSNIVARIVVAVFFVFVLFFGGMAAGFALGRWTGETYWGFLIVTGIYFITGIAVWLTRERIIRIPVMNSIIKQLFKEQDNDEEDQEY